MLGWFLLGGLAWHIIGYLLIAEYFMRKGGYRG